MPAVYKKLIRNIVTEKSSNRQATNGQYTFQVSRDATKVDIKKAMKELYGADVEKVQIMISPKKERLLKKGQVWVKRPVMKKAIVTLKGKQTIDPNKFEKDKSSEPKVKKVTKSTKSKA